MVLWWEALASLKSLDSKYFMAEFREFIIPKFYSGLREDLLGCCIESERASLTIVSYDEGTSNGLEALSCRE